MVDSNSRNGGAGAEYARYMGLGFAFVGAILGLATAGFFVDRLLGTPPLFMLLGIVAGFVGGIYYAYSSLKGLDEE